MTLRFHTKLKSTPSLIDLTPLVDVIFLMLIFFLITSDILPLKSLSIQPPTLSQDATPLTTQLLVVMDAQNVIYVGSKKKIVALSHLKPMIANELETILQQRPEAQPTVVLSVDEQVEYGLFLQLFAVAQEMSVPIRLVFHPALEEEVL